MMIRGLNSIHAQALLPQNDSQKRSFAGYALCWCEFTHHHHSGEELFFFPACEKRRPGSMEENVEQHHTFMEGFETMDKYFNAVRKNPSIYDGKQVQSIIEKFGDVFCKHLTEEIDTIKPAKIRELFPEEQDFKDVVNEFTKYIVNTANKLTTMPWVCFLSLRYANERHFLITNIERLLGF
jgi:Hemerythrin HHE cation binding domain